VELRHAKMIVIQMENVTTDTVTALMVIAGNFVREEFAKMIAIKTGIV